MKKIALFFMVLSVMAACRKGPAVIDGTITGYNGQGTTFLQTDPFERGEYVVSEDGTFHIERNISAPAQIIVSVAKAGSANLLLLPGETYSLSLDLTATPAAWTVESSCPSEMAFFDYYRNDFCQMDFRSYVFPDTFAEYEAFWDARVADATSRLKSVRSAAARKYLADCVSNTAANNKFSYAWQMQKRGVAYDSDPDFMAFFNSIDLGSERNQRTLLRNMITVKEACYCDTISAGVRHIMAIDELCPTRELRDSVTREYLVNTFKDAKISSRYEGDYLLDKAAGLIADEAEMQSYRESVAKAVALLRGNPAIDFRMTDPSGKTIMLSELKGKVVYVDFWATWCIPCCLQIPHMKVLAAKYASNPHVACISVSMDKDLAMWKSFLKSDSATWPQYVAENAGKDIMDAYGFRAIPRFMLFDQDGKIVTINAPRPQDAAAVSELIDSLL